MANELTESQLPLVPPRETWVDHARKLVMVGADALTFGTASVVSDMVLGLGRRRESFDLEVAERIVELEKQHRVNWDMLKEDQQFLSTQIEATIAAVKTHNKIKRQALRNAVLNAALRGAHDETRQSLFICWIDELEEVHLRVLDEARRRPFQPGRFDTFLKWVPEVRGFEKVVENDLVSRNLIKPDHTGAVVQLKHGEVWATQLGIEFLNFTVDPLDNGNPPTQ